MLSEQLNNCLLLNMNWTESHSVEFTVCIFSCCAGLVAATMGTPADVVKTRIMNQPTDIKGK
jgi:solute carrier family 25 (mitochondrial uncoupling protein), member 27